MRRRALLRCGVLSGALVAFVAASGTAGAAPRVVLHMLADEAAAAHGQAEPARRTLGSVSHYVLGDPGAVRIATPQVRVPPGAEVRLALAVETEPASSPVRFAIEARTVTRAAALLSRTLRPAPSDWTDIRISLDEARLRVGPEFGLVFKTRTERGTRLLWADPRIVGPPDTGPARPNVVLVSIDTLRADRIGCYGGPPTPTLDRLAAEGAVFEIALGAAPVTRPSHATMLTGVYPCVHRMGVAPGDELPAGLPTLATLLRRAGYTTAAITEGGYLDGAFARGFGLFRTDAAGTLERPGGRVEDVVADTRAWLAQHPDEQFFLFVHTYQPHFPYTPPARYRADPSPRMVRSPAVPAAMYATYDPDLYDAEVRYTDDSLAPLFAALEDLGLARETVVIVTSDHGEAFGEHGRFLHGDQLYEEDLRVPLIWWAPGRIPPGRRLPAVASLADVVPTVLDLTRLHAPGWLHGRDLARALVGDAPAVSGENMAYAELPDAGAPTHLVAVRGWQWKSIFSFPYVPGSPMTLFVLPTDPQERNPTDISREHGVSWTFYLTQECERAMGRGGGLSPSAD
jgi:arylsulfatase A-like enzyme